MSVDFSAAVREALRAVQELHRSVEMLTIFRCSQGCDRIEAGVEGVRSAAEALERLPTGEWQRMRRVRAVELRAGIVEAVALAEPTGCEAVWKLTKQVAHLMETVADVPGGPRWFSLVVEAVRARLPVGAATDAGLQRLRAEAERELAVLGKAPPAESEGGAPPAGFVFCRDGDGWLVRGYGQEGHFTKMRGFEHIHKLLAAPGGVVLMVELVAEANEHGTASAGDLAPEDVAYGVGLPGGDEVLGPEARKGYRKRLEDIETELDRAHRNNDLAALESLEGEKQTILDELTSATGLGGRGRKLGDETARLRSRIGKALGRACDALEKGGLPKAANHFRLTVSAQGSTYVYRADERPAWSLSCQ